LHRLKPRPKSTVDASIMPAIASSNLNAIVMMMAEKLSDTILGLQPLPRLD
jgi:choline dehydrogenase